MRIFRKIINAILTQRLQAVKARIMQINDKSVATEIDVTKTPVKRRTLPPGPGRPKGMPNKITVEFRETVRKLLDDNRKNVSKWLEEVAAKDPARALDLLAKLAEYAAPKLSRTEVSGPNNGPVAVSWSSSNVTVNNLIGANSTNGPDVSRET